MTEARVPQGLGRPVVEEAARLLDGLVFSSGRAGYARGDLVAVSCDPDWTDDGKVSVLITCHAFARATVDWSGLSAWAWYQEDDGRVRLALAPAFDARGQAYLPDLPPSHYVLGVHRRRDVVQPSGRPIDFIFPAGPGEKAAAAAPPVTSDELDLEGPQVIRSADGSIRAEVLPAKDRVTVTFTTARTELAGRTVFLAVVDDETGHILASGEIPLVIGEKKPGSVIGTWEGRVSIAKPCKVLLQVVPIASDS
jgi:hypothetical protein